MSGTIPLSMTQQFDKYGDLLAGGLLYFFVAGTVSTPQNSFQDGALTLPWPNPITLDATGRVPQLFLADGVIKFRLTDKDGIVQLAADGVQVIGASSGGGGGGTVDPTTIAQTGDLKLRYGTGAYSGWLPCNGGTIGSAGSSATLQSGTAVQALFNYLWSADPNLVVSGGGRGANATNDWNTNKTIAVPDYLGCTLGVLDAMSSAPAGRLTAASFAALAPTVLGALGGTEQRTMTVAQMPTHHHDTTEAAHTHTATTDALKYVGGSGVAFAAGGSQSVPGAVTVQTAKTNLTINDNGSSQPMPCVQATKLASLYIKL